MDLGKINWEDNQIEFKCTKIKSMMIAQKIIFCLSYVL